MTKKSIIMQPLLASNGSRTTVVFETDPYTVAQGVIRNIQKYCVLLLTNKGTDTLHPYFGTQFATIPLRNISTLTEMRLFISDQIKDATNQFFAMQNADTTLVEDDILIGVSVVSIDISNISKISVTLKFVPKTSNAITLSLSV